jgi:hypothetical protein
MKKILLLFIAIIVCSTLMAQVHRVANMKELYKGVVLKKDVPASFGAEQYTEFIPTYRPNMLHSKGKEYINIIGETHYNSSTNDCARNTVSFKPNTANAAAVWTMAPEAPPSAPQRGTGINHYIDDEWGVMPNKEDGRIESMRTGWGVHAFTQDGEIVVAHNALTSLEGGLVINTRDKWGEDEWNEYVLQGPEYTIKSPNYNSPEVPTTGLLWPSIATNGDIVHVICVTEQWNSTGLGPNDDYPEGYATGYLGISTVPLYYRSQDGGKTWDKKAIDFRTFGMTDFEMQRTSADGYSIAVKEDHVVFVYHEKFHFIHYMESTDGGNTWVKKDVYDFDFDWGPNIFQQPRLVPSTAAIYIDETDRVHVAFGTRLHSRAPDQQENYYTYHYAYPCGVVYWNSDYDPITWLELSANTITPNNNDVDFDNDKLWPLKNYPRYIEVPSVLGFDNFYYWENSPVYSRDYFRDLGFTIFPRIIAKNEKIYVSYQTAIEHPLTFKEGTNFYRGIFMTVSDDDGKTMNSFDNTSWLTYGSQLFLCDWSQYEGPQYDENGDPFYNGSIAMTWFSENAYPSMSINTSPDNKVIIQWYNQYEPFPVSTSPVILSDPINMYTLIQNLSVFPEYANLRKVYKGESQETGITENPTINLKIYPNPATEGIVNIKVDTNRPYTITVTNIMGQVVHNMTGNSNKTELNISNFIPGVYLVTVKTNKTIATQKLIVK